MANRGNVVYDETYPKSKESELYASDIDAMCTAIIFNLEEQLGVEKVTANLASYFGNKVYRTQDIDSSITTELNGVKTNVAPGEFIKASHVNSIINYVNNLSSRVCSTSVVENVQIICSYAKENVQVYIPITPSTVTTTDSNGVITTVVTDEYGNVTTTVQTPNEGAGSSSTTTTTSSVNEYGGTYFDSIVTITSADGNIVATVTTESEYSASEYYIGHITTKIDTTTSTPTYTTTTTTSTITPESAYINQCTLLSRVCKTRKKWATGWVYVYSDTGPVYECTSTTTTIDADYVSSPLNLDQIQSINVGDIILADHIALACTNLRAISEAFDSTNAWWDSDNYCAKGCQVACQTTCQLACQSCYGGTCHNQNCGGFS